MKNFYADSRKASTLKVTFDLNAVGWCEPFQLSLLVLWISELIHKNKKIFFIPPNTSSLPRERPLSQEDKEKRIKKRNDVFSYLFENKFIKFLFDNRVLAENDLEGYRTERREKPLESSISPLVFFSDAQNFKDFMNQIEKQHKFIFEPVLDLHVIKYGEIREIILKEIGENIFDHAKGRFGHLLMTLRNKIKGNEKEKALKRNARINVVPKFEQGFFYSLGDSGYLNVVISDKGPGIQKTLLPSYKEDNILPNKKERPPEHEIIDYSFFQHTTRKNPKERLGKLVSLINKYDLAETLPATGLYWVYEVAKTYRGMLTVRSGRSLFCYDFLTYPDLGHPENYLLTNEIDKRTKSLKNFGGTQIKLCFPTDILISEEKKYFFPAQLINSDTDKEYLYHSLSLGSPAPNGKNSQELCEWLDYQISFFQKMRLASGTSKTIILDCQDFNFMEEKALKVFFLLVVELMRMQNKNFSHVIFCMKGVLDRITSYINDITKTKPGIPKEKPILIFDENLEMSIFGLSEEELEIFYKILYAIQEGNTFHPEDLESYLLKKIEHLLIYDTSSNTFSSLFSISEIRKRMIEAFRERLALIILDPKNKIYYHEGCFLIPSGAFSEGYFGLRPLLSNEKWKKDIISWIGYCNENLRPNVLVTFSKWAESLGKFIVKIYEGINHLKIHDVSDISERHKLSLLPKNEKVIILTDVIGTQRSLDTVLSYCHNLDVQMILTIVDAREKGESESIKFNGRKWKLTSILRKPIKFWYEDKPPHFSYEEIIRIDPLSDAPITEPFLMNQPIWQIINEKTGENSFLNKIMKETNGIIIGHFESTERHIIYLFITFVIANTYGRIIANLIYEDISKYKGIDPNLDKYKISHIFYPTHTPAADKVANHISLEIGDCKVIGVTHQEIKHPLSFNSLAENIGNAIIFDDATSTGYHIRQMIEIVERSGAKSIFIYSLCNRGEREKSRQLQKMQLYGHSTLHMRFLCELPIPTFSAEECAICNSIKVLETLKIEVKEIKKLAKEIDKEIYALQKHPISLTLSSDTVSPYLSSPLEDRIIQTDLRAKLEMAKTVIPVRRQLVELVRNYKVNPHRVLLFFILIAREESYFVNDTITFKEVFYDGFKKSIIEVCKYFIDRISDLSVEQITVILAILRIFDPNSLVECLNRIDKSSINENLLLKIMVQLLRSKGIRQQAYYITNILENWSSNIEISLFRSLVQFWENIAHPAPRSHLLFKNYLTLNMGISDSALLSNSFAGLELNKFLFKDLKIVTELVNDFWKTISSLLKDNIIPSLFAIVNSQISRTICRELHEKIILANSLIIKSDELAELILNRKIDMQIRKTAVDGFHSAITELHSIFLEYKENTIKKNIVALRTDLCRIIRGLKRQYESEFKKQKIKLKLEIPDDSRLVFGNRVEVYSISKILIENVITRAFIEIEKRRKKNVLIKIKDDSKKNLVVLEVLDSGKGIKPDLKYGYGLITLENISHKICNSWKIESIENSPFKTSAVVKFFSIPQE